VFGACCMSTAEKNWVLITYLTQLTFIKVLRLTLHYSSCTRTINPYHACFPTGNSVLSTRTCMFFNQLYILAVNVIHTFWYNTTLNFCHVSYTIYRWPMSCMYRRVMFYNNSLSRPLSSRTVHSRLVVHHCRNSSILSLLSVLLALFRCACVSSFSILVQFF